MDMDSYFPVPTKLPHESYEDYMKRLRESNITGAALYARDKMVAEIKAGKWNDAEMPLSGEEVLHAAADMEINEFVNCLSSMGFY